MMFTKTSLIGFIYNSHSLSGNMLFKMKPLQGSRMSLINNRPFKTIKINDSCIRRHKVTEEDLIYFAKASGDKSPLHLNHEYAATTLYKKRIAHSMFTGGLISAAIAIDLPGPGTIYLSQDIQFKRPVFINDILTVQLRVIEKHHVNPMVTLECLVTNQYDKSVVTGITKVMAPTVSISVETSEFETFETAY